MSELNKIMTCASYVGEFLNVLTAGVLTSLGGFLCVFVCFVLFFSLSFSIVLCRKLCSGVLLSLGIAC